MKYSFLRASVLILVAVCSSFAQTEQSSSAATTQTADAAIRAKALNQLQALAGQLGSLQSAENRARIGSNIVGSLWKHDEQRARTLLRAVEEDIKLGLQNAEAAEPRDVPTLMVFLRLRTDTIERVAKHDAELALEFLKSTTLISDKPLPYNVESEQALELRLAKQIAADNPDIAVNIARQSLARNFSPDLLLLLTSLERKHKPQALTLYKEIVSKLRQTNLARDWNASSFARRLASNFAPPLADDATYRDLINLLITHALAVGCGSASNPPNNSFQFCGQLGMLLPQIEKIDPWRAGQLKRWSREGSPWEQYSEAYSELASLNDTGTVDEILALARKYPQIESDLHMQAIYKARASGDVDRARKLALEFRGDPARQRLILSELDNEQKWSALTEEKLEEAQKKLSTIVSLQERVAFLGYVANQLGPSQNKTALALLDQASGMIDAIGPAKSQIHLQLGLALLYCSKKSERGFTIMESLVPKLNELIAAAAKLDGFDGRYLRDGEWNMSAETALGRLLTGLSDYAGTFAWCDFDRAVEIANQFERPEIRMMAHLKLAQGILTGPKKLPIGSPSPRW